LLVHAQDDEEEPATIPDTLYRWDSVKILEPGQNLVYDVPIFAS
jgi:hypothetical protein